MTSVPVPSLGRVLSSITESVTTHIKPILLATASCPWSCTHIIGSSITPQATPHCVLKPRGGHQLVAKSEDRIGDDDCVETMSQKCVKILGHSRVHTICPLGRNVQRDTHTNSSCVMVPRHGPVVGTIPPVWYPSDTVLSNVLKCSTTLCVAFAHRCQLPGVCGDGHLAMTAFTSNAGSLIGALDCCGSLSHHHLPTVINALVRHHGSVNGLQRSCVHCIIAAQCGAYASCQGQLCS